MAIIKSVAITGKIALTERLNLVIAYITNSCQMFFDLLNFNNYKLFFALSAK